MIEGCFSYEPSLASFLEERGIDQETESIIIRREILSSGKSLCRINGSLISLSEVVELGEMLGDIHSQNDTLGLVNPKNYLHFLEDEAVREDLTLYTQALKKYRTLLKEHETLEKQVIESKEKEEFYKFQIKELELAKLSVLEEEALKQELHQLSSYEALVELLKDFHEKVHESNALSNLYSSLQILQKLEKIDSRFESVRANFESHYYDLESDLEDSLLKVGNLEYDEKRVEDINSRLALYSDMRRKYKKDTAELVSYYDQIKKQLDQIEHADDYLMELNQKVQVSYHETLAIALKIRNLRQQNAHDHEVELMKQLQDLELKNTTFEVVFKELSNPMVFLSDGIDVVDFMVSFNKGEPKKSFAKVASGGEMSRFMLALKSIIALKLPLQMKVFDEIDHGVSGLVAYKIAEKMKAIAKTSQVLCITHLPQVASIGDQHLKIKKQVIDSRTITNLARELLGSHSR